MEKIKWTFRATQFFLFLLTGPSLPASDTCNHDTRQGQREVMYPEAELQRSYLRCLATSSLRMSSLLRGHSLHLQVEFVYVT